MNVANNIQTAWIASLAVAASAVIVLLLMRLIYGRRQKELEKHLSEKYKFIYRVHVPPQATQWVLQAQETAIISGDYGWEAEPIHDDGLIYLHGLNDRWQVVWYAAFSPDQVEKVTPKPKSQYYVYPYWMNPSKIPACPFPVKKFQHGKYKHTHLGFPVKIHNRWVQGVHVAEATVKE